MLPGTVEGRTKARRAGRKTAASSAATRKNSRNVRGRRIPRTLLDLRSDGGRQSVDGESLASTRKMQSADKVRDKGPRDGFRKFGADEFTLSTKRNTWKNRKRTSVTTTDTGRNTGIDSRRIGGDRDAKIEVNLAAANGMTFRVEGDVRKGKNCCMKFLDADVKRPLASVSAITDGGKQGRVWSPRIVHWIMKYSLVELNAETESKAKKEDVGFLELA